MPSRARAARMPTRTYVVHIPGTAIESNHRHAASNLEQQLDSMASQIPSDTTSEQMETALEEALAAVRPLRSWPP